MWRQRRTKKRQRTNWKLNRGRKVVLMFLFLVAPPESLAPRWKSARPPYCPSVSHKASFVPLLIYDIPGSSKPSGTRVVYIFFFCPVKYEWESLSAVNSWPKDKAGNEHTAARQHWTRPFFFLQATSFTVASGHSLMAFRNSKSIERKGLEGVKNP